MNDDEKLVLLKCDLQMITKANDDYLRALLNQALPLILNEGIVNDKSYEFEMLQIQYAAYLFRKRASNDTQMPRFLRYALNNLLFKPVSYTHLSHLSGR